MVFSDRKAIIYLDMMLLAMTVMWVIFSVISGVDTIELAYSYIYMVILTITLLLNMKVLSRK